MSSKYGNTKLIYNDIKFDSKLECEFYICLIKAKEEGKIKDFTLKPKFILQDKFEKHQKKHRAITYTADFTVIDNEDNVHVIDCKGVETVEFKIKKKLFLKKFDFPLHCLTHIKKYGGWIEIEEYKRKRKQLKKKV